MTNVGIMHAGVYNGKKKPAKELIESVRWWNGVPVTVESEAAIGDHPPTGIVTSKTVITGQVTNSRWNDKQQRIDGDIHFIRSQTPSWLQENLTKREVTGVSGAYFCSFSEENGEENGKAYDAVELNYRPNNLAIVERPACKPPECGIFTNSTEDLHSDHIIETNSGGKVMVETPIEDLIKVEVSKREIELNSEHKTALDAKDRELADKVTEIAQLNSQIKELGDKFADATKKIEEIELNSKKLKFIGQFPEVNREQAEKDLWPVYLENPSDLVMNSSKIAELMQVAEDPKGQGKEFVKNSDTEDSDLPSADEIKKQMGL